MLGILYAIGAVILCTLAISLWTIPFAACFFSKVKDKTYGKLLCTVVIAGIVIAFPIVLWANGFLPTSELMLLAGRFFCTEALVLLAVFFPSKLFKK